LIVLANIRFSDVDRIEHHFIILLWFVTGSVNTPLMDELDYMVLWKGQLGLKTLGLWMYFSEFVLNLKFGNLNSECKPFH
jgi:hypothetical protein